MWHLCFFVKASGFYQYFEFWKIDGPQSSLSKINMKCWMGRYKFTLCQSSLNTYLYKHT